MITKHICKLFLFGTIMFGSIIHAQTVKGVVSDADGPMPQANVNVKGTSNYATTDLDGNYIITNVDPNAILIFSYIGYQSQEIAVGGKTNLNVILTADLNTLNEVVIVGYTSEKKSAITGAVVTVDMSELSKTKVSDVGQALQGQVAGVSVSANTGAPGDGLKIRIRGEGTLGNNEVLYVVDGVATRDISFLNMSDVKSMTVLKDAAATAIYGSRSSGGVVILTTKSGAKGKSNIDVEYYSGTSYATNLPKMLNADQYLTIMDQAWHNSNNNPANAISPYSADITSGKVNGIALSDTNWLKELFASGKTDNLQLSFSGGSEKTQYLISGGYFGQNGIVVGDKDTYKRINFRANINTEVTDRFKVGTNFQITSTKQDKMSSSGDAPGVIRHALLRPSVLGIYKDVNDPTYKENDPYTDLPFYLNNNPNGGWSRNYELTSNPLAIVHFTDDVRSAFKTFGNVYGEYAFLADKSLKFRSNFGAEIIFDHNKAFGENYGDDNDNDPNELYPGQGRQNRPSSLNENRGQATTFTFTNTLNYTKTLAEKHSINALLGEETVSYDQSAVGGSRINYNNTTDPFRYLDYGSDTSKNSSGSAQSWNLISFFASANYGYDSKYFASGTIRADGSSRFGPNNKWGYFPSVSGGWVMSKEKFMENAKWISNLKWRASWGQSGNQEIPNNAYETLVTETGGIISVVRYGNPDLKWETTTQTNFGLDLSILNNKLTFSVDYFDKTTNDILLAVGLPSATVGQINKTYVNAGVVTNKGFEFGANFQNNDHEFKYGINGNIATLKNNVEQLQQYVSEINDDKTHTKTVVGQPISSYYGLKFDGIYQNQAEINSTLYSNSNGAKPGDIKFKDLNGDGQINADDRTFIGSSIPKITYGFSFNAEYKRFDMSFLFQGVSGVDRYNDLKQILDYDSRPFNSTTAVLGAWNGEGTSNTTPRNTMNDNGGSQVSSVFVEDASYLRLKNLEIGYTFDPKIIGDTYLRMYISGQNLLTFTKYTGLDPESTSFIDQGTYPQSSSILIGLKFKI
ncbi:TonB-dependent receptor [Flavobacterium sp. ANB]|uniref:SusC/RagA family TonB-linked outer membrane protein n=1 Tax=unclassified Flavobacterium TaxID=196869 RepID=UPI0012B9DE77|nr:MULTISPECIES: TonB-dependent receptor [unclassified Flavobacterium]MBF4519103.1 TonB-dependent receptor [Flavobacterium sp. ANB]MTD71697.1 SusC/RagA family TonB-linked outer membrane protein [Flavobacterium sp. LC2016-13]